VIPFGIVCFLWKLFCLCISNVPLILINCYYYCLLFQHRLYTLLLKISSSIKVSFVMLKLFCITITCLFFNCKLIFLFLLFASLSLALRFLLIYLFLIYIFYVFFLHCLCFSLSFSSYSSIAFFLFRFFSLCFSLSLSLKFNFCLIYFVLYLAFFV